jgi:hypothetical protein
VCAASSSPAVAVGAAPESATGPHQEAVWRLRKLVADRSAVIVGRPDGSARHAGGPAAETEQILATIGHWLAINGEAIYATRPWVTCWHGTLRFTRKPDAVYVIVLSWSETSNVLTIPELGQHQGIGRVTNVRLIGYDGELRWGQDTDEKGALRVA